MSDINTVRKRISENRKKLDDIHYQLNSSLDLQEEFPNVFEHGAVTSTLKGRLKTSPIGMGYTPRSFLDMDFVVTLGNGSQITRKVRDLKNKKLVYRVLEPSIIAVINKTAWDFDEDDYAHKVKQRKALEKRKKDFYQETP